MTARRRRVTAAAVGSLCWLFAVGTASAHGGSLAAGGRESLTIPTWLFLSTGGAAVGASFLLASFVTDRSFVERVHSWGTPLVDGGVRIPRLLGRTVGLLGLAAVLVVGFLGPTTPRTNLAILLVWVGWWAGLAMTTYLVGNSWRVLNPLSTLALVLPSLDRDYPERLGAWPSVVGLLALVWLEVVSPLADDARLLATVVLGYSVLTLAGAVVFGRETWFDDVDPVERVFRYYGRVAPVGRRGDGSLHLRLPGIALSERRLVDGADEVAFVVALLWVTTYDGLVTTPGWRDLTTPLVDAGLPAHLLYPLALLAGFALFLGVYRLAVRASTRTAETYLAPDELAERFAPPLLAIAAGYHFAHYLGYFLFLAPALGAATLAPFADPVSVPVYQLPGWFGGVALASVVVGHLLAIWVAHAAAFDLFPSRLQAIRSQYPFVAVMVFYTMTSLWVVSRPEVPLPHL
ncbi:hypothetical protein EGH21_16465 [Halomicroarcula sp. F13]|uniref:Uncharacterized protein n=1 Tax=Haloarcula rubra TaxID=2487747 RepID=A0AAW4PSM7_9EURY|nr:hypothetical protein [Halomicroarcula rubra]MBX0324623.1 hypothetical protein [Halomicroarcula rubra]